MTAVEKKKVMKQMDDVVKFQRQILEMLKKIVAEMETTNRIMSGK